MKKRKLRQPSNGKAKPPLTRLKELPSAERAKLMEVLRANTYAQAEAQFESLVGFACSVGVLSQFFQWQSTQEDLETSNDLVEQFEEFCRKQNPDWSLEKVREMAMGFFIAHATAKKDLKGFAQIASLDLEERKSKTKAKFESQKISISDRRVTLLEKKAAQADQAKAVTASQLTPEQKDAEYRRIFGMAS
jgi:hypothetical protein